LDSCHHECSATDGKMKTLATNRYRHIYIYIHFALKLRRSRGVWWQGMEHKKTFSRTLARFCLTWHQKVNFSTFDGKLELQCTRGCSRRSKVAAGPGPTRGKGRLWECQGRQDGDSRDSPTKSRAPNAHGFASNAPCTWLGRLAPFPGGFREFQGDGALVSKICKNETCICVVS